MVGPVTWERSIGELVPPANRDGGFDDVKPKTIVNKMAHLAHETRPSAMVDTALILNFATGFEILLRGSLG